jgi:hypothetical protein
MIKAVVGGVPVHIWFTPSFNVKTNEKALELFLRSAELESFDPWEMRMRKVKATKSLHDAFLILEEYRVRVPELKITFEEAPEVPSSVALGTKEAPVLE